MTSIIKFSVEELKKLIKDETSCVHKKTVIHNIGIQPWCLSNIVDSVSKIFEDRIGKFDNDLDGIILSFKKIKIMQDIGVIRHDCPEIYTDVSVDLYFFKPHEGARLRGLINNRSSSHLGVLVHGVFNVVIPRPAGPRDTPWLASRLSLGQEVWFTVTLVDLFLTLPYIRGVLDESCLPPLQEDDDKDDPKPKRLSVPHVNFDGIKPKSVANVKPPSKSQMAVEESSESDAESIIMPQNATKNESTDDDSGSSESEDGPDIVKRVMKLQKPRILLRDEPTNKSIAKESPKTKSSKKTKNIECSSPSQSDNIILKNSTELKKTSKTQSNAVSDSPLQSDSIKKDSTKSKKSQVTKIISPKVCESHTKDDDNISKDTNKSNKQSKTQKVNVNNSPILSDTSISKDSTKSNKSPTKKNNICDSPILSECSITIKSNKLTKSKNKSKCDSPPKSDSNISNDSMKLIKSKSESDSNSSRLSIVGKHLKVDQSFFTSTPISNDEPANKKNANKPNFLKSALKMSQKLFNDTAEIKSLSPSAKKILDKKQDIMKTIRNSVHFKNDSDKSDSSSDSDDDVPSKAKIEINNTEQLKMISLESKNENKTGKKKAIENSTNLNETKQKILEAVQRLHNIKPKSPERFKYRGKNVSSSDSDSDVDTKWDVSTTQDNLLKKVLESKKKNINLLNKGPPEILIADKSNELVLSGLDGKKLKKKRKDVNAIASILSSDELPASYNNVNEKKKKKSSAVKLCNSQSKIPKDIMNTKTSNKSKVSKTVNIIVLESEEETDISDPKLNDSHKKRKESQNIKKREHGNGSNSKDISDDVGTSDPERSFVSKCDLPFSNLKTPERMKNIPYIEGIRPLYDSPTAVLMGGDDCPNESHKKRKRKRNHSPSVSNLSISQEAHHSHDEPHSPKKKKRREVNENIEIDDLPPSKTAEVSCENTTVLDSTAVRDTSGKRKKNKHKLSDTTPAEIILVCTNSNEIKSSKKVKRVKIKSCDDIARCVLEDPSLLKEIEILINNRNKL